MVLEEEAKNSSKSLTVYQTWVKAEFEKSVVPPVLLQSISDGEALSFLSRILPPQDVLNK
jgi:hypothetical protein